MAKQCKLCYIILLCLLHTTFITSQVAPASVPSPGPGPSPPKTGDAPTPGPAAPSPHNPGVPPILGPAPSPHNPGDPPILGPAPSPHKPSDPPTPEVPPPSPPPPASPTPQPQPRTPDDKPIKGKKGLSGGQKAGIVIGTFLGAGLLWLGGTVYKKRRSNIRRTRLASQARTPML